MRTLAAAFLVLCAGCTVTGLPAPEVVTAKPYPIALPYREGPGGLVLLKGDINGKGRHEFILDTGAPVTVILDGPRTAKLGFDTSNARPLGDPNDAATPTGIVALGNAVDFDGVQLKALAAVVVPRRTLPCQERFDAVDFDAVVGADLFRSFVVDIDPGEKRVTLHDPKTWQPPRGATAMPLVFRAGHPYLQAPVQVANGVLRAADLHLDTGQNRAITLHAGTDPLIAFPADGAPSTLCGVSGAREARRGPPAAVLAGSITLTDASPTYFAAGSMNPDRKHGSIGIALFQGRRIAVDYPGRRLVLFSE